MRRPNAALGLLTTILVLGIIHATPACKTASRTRLKPVIVPPPTTTLPPTTTELPKEQVPSHGLSMTSIIIAPNKMCPPGSERDHKGRCRTKIE